MELHSGKRLFNRMLDFDENGLPDTVGYWFVSEEALQAFKKDPEKFLPEYGGWCAYGMAEGYAAETDPVNGWTIHEGRLYLNWNAEVSEQWNADKKGFLEKSEAQWPTVNRQLSQGTATVYWHD